MHSLPAQNLLRLKGTQSLIVLLAFSLPPSAHGLSANGEDWEVRLDSSVSIGAQFRLEDPDPALLGLPVGGRQYSVNADDGNLNYGQGLVSLPAVATFELEGRYRDFGSFFRVSAFYDYENMQGTRERTELTREAEEQVGHDLRLLDAYLWGDWVLGGVPVQLRFGNQVLNWGESTFIPNGINAINPVDVSKLRLPGAELRDALLPVPSLSASADLSDSLTLELFYQFQWKRVILDPPGTYFSTNDFVGKGGQHVFLGFGALPDDGPLGFIPRGPDRNASNQGQFGAALRYFSESLNNTEFGLFAMKYHNRVPVLSARTPSSAINRDLTLPLTSVFLQAGLPADMAAAQASGIQQLLVIQATNPAALTPAQIATLQAPQTAAALAGAQQIAFLQSAATGRYLVEYPEDVVLLGLSFNTDLGATGISLQGEISYRWDQPLQVDDVELLFSALSSINPVYASFNQLGDFTGQLDTYVQGFIRESVWQAQITATRVFGPVLGADQWVLLGEIGATHIPGMPDKDELRLEGSGTYVGGNEAATAAGLQPATEPAESFADRFSWGYRLVSSLNYNDLFLSVNASPFVQFAHDVQGNTPLPLGTFQAERKAITLGLNLSYQISWSASLSYTNFFGGGRLNLLGDRDFVSATVGYSF